MARYQTGTAATLDELLTQLRAFAVSHGFTVDYFGPRSAGSGIALQLTHGPLHATVLTDAASTGTDPGPRIGVYGHAAYQAASGTETQAEASAKTWTNAVVTPLQGYHFFGGSDNARPYLYAALETTPGTYKHFGFGQLIQHGTFENGTFAFACRWHYDATYISNCFASRHAIAFDSGEDSYRHGPSLQVRADSDAITPRWYDAHASASRLGGGFRAPNQSYQQRATVTGLVRYGASQITGRTVLTPCWLSGERTSQLYSPLGFPPNVRWVRLDYLSPGEILEIGGDRWLCLPIIRKNGSNGQPNSENYGYAYRID
ncbi:MAG: hypothetical protein LBV45_02060 [Xanthomonadaceae bacterium]|jgi:hypothetical protein|nr:hypothetical protein [Xanthomonadaceae bacterium]